MVYDIVPTIGSVVPAQIWPTEPEARLGVVSHPHKDKGEWIGEETQGTFFTTEHYPWQDALKAQKSPLKKRAHKTCYGRMPKTKEVEE